MFEETARPKIAMLEKEKEILRGKITGKLITGNRSDRIFFVD
jgi:hypothetical protein